MKSLNFLAYKGDVQMPSTDQNETTETTLAEKIQDLTPKEFTAFKGEVKALLSWIKQERHNIQGVGTSHQQAIEKLSNLTDQGNISIAPDDEALIKQAVTIVYTQLKATASTEIRAIRARTKEQMQNDPEQSCAQLHRGSPGDCAQNRVFRVRH